MIGPNVNLLTASHRYGSHIPWQPFQIQGEDVAPLFIGKGSWLGAGVTVLRGVTIGSDVVVAAGSVVTHDLLGSGVYAGIPAEIDRHPSVPLVEPHGIVEAYKYARSRT